MRWLLVGCFVIGCGGRSGSDAALCETLGKLCAANDITAKDLAECARELPRLKEQLGDRYGKLVSCSAEATTCAEALGCVTGAAMGTGLDVFDQFARGARQTLGSNGGVGTDPGEPLPVECSRFADVCGSGELLTRSRCVEMVRDLKADDEHRHALAACYMRAKNCYAFDACTSDMWFKLH